MREFIVLGRPNSGKTMFTLNFAAYNGNKTVDILFRSYDGLTTCQHFSIEEARNQLCNVALHQTRSLQSIVLKTVHGKATVLFKITDTCGITEKIHPDEKIRQGMCQTLNLLRSADYIFHLIDLSANFKEDMDTITTIDREIYNYGMARKCYTLLANKTDLPTSQHNLITLTYLFPQAKIIPVSSLCSQGFKEVKACVANNI